MQTHAHNHAIMTDDSKILLVLTLLLSLTCLQTHAVVILGDEHQATLTHHKLTNTMNLSRLPSSTPLHTDARSRDTRG